MTKTLSEIREILTKRKDELKEKYNIKNIGIFGSFIRGEQNARSDVDILVEFNKLPDIFLLIDLEEYLKKLLHKKVDLVRKSAIRPELKDDISKEAVYI